MSFVCQALICIALIFVALVLPSIFRALDDIAKIAERLADEIHWLREEIKNHGR